MPDFNITTPDGQKYKVTAPEGATQEQVLAYAQQHHESKSKPNTEPQLNAIERGAAERALGTEELINNAGIGKHIGLPSNDILEGAKNIAEEQGKGKGFTGWLGETVGDPLSWAGGAEWKAAQGVKQLVKVGAKYGGIGGATEGGKDIKENLKNAAVGATAGAALSPTVAAIPGAIKETGKTAKLLGEGFGVRTQPELLEAAQNLRKEADIPYAKMRELNANITPEAAQKLKPEIADALKKQGLLNPQLHRGTISVLKQLDNASKNGISLEALDQYRRLLSGVVNDSRGKEDGKMASAAIRSIDDLVDKLKPDDLSNKSREAVDALQAGRAAWAKARKFETVTDILEKADGDPNRRKVLLEALSNNRKKTSGWSKEEIADLKDAARNNTAEGLAKMAGKFGINIGSSRAAATGSALPLLDIAVQGTKKGIPQVIGATIGKMGGNKIGQAKVERLLKTIEKGKSANEALGAEIDPLAIKGEIK